MVSTVWLLSMNGNLTAGSPFRKEVASERYWLELHLDGTSALLVF